MEGQQIGTTIRKYALTCLVVLFLGVTALGQQYWGQQHVANGPTPVNRFQATSVRAVVELEADLYLVEIFTHVNTQVMGRRVTIPQVAYVTMSGEHFNKIVAKRGR